MTAQEIDQMTREMRRFHAKVDTRFDFENYVYCLMKGLYVIGRKELAEELWNLYEEMENVNTNEVYEIGTFEGR